MPEEDDIIEQPSAPQPQEPQPQPEAEQQAEEETIPEDEAAAEAEEQPKNRGLVALLTTLILLCLVVEVALASYIGLALYRNVQNKWLYTAQYEAYLAQQEQARENPPKVQYIGPTVRVVDGVLVDSSAAAQAARAQAEGNIPGI